MQSSDTSSTMSIVLPKMTAPMGMVTFVYLDVCRREEGRSKRIGGEKQGSTE